MTTEKTSLEAQGTYAPVTAEVVGPICTTDAGVVSHSLNDQVRQYIRASKAENTLRGYRSDWRDFCAWCEAHELKPLPALPEDIAAYISDAAGHLNLAPLKDAYTPSRKPTRPWGSSRPRTALLLRIP